MLFRSDAVTLPELGDAVAQVRRALQALGDWLAASTAQGSEVVEAGARQFAFGLSRTFIAALLLEHAEWSAREADGAMFLSIARRWHERPLTDLVDANRARLEANQAIALSWRAEP